MRYTQYDYNGLPIHFCGCHQRHVSDSGNTETPCPRLIGVSMAWADFGWHPCWGAIHVNLVIRWCHFAQPPATGFHTSGMKNTEAPCPHIMDVSKLKTMTASKVAIREAGGFPACSRWLSEVRATPPDHSPQSDRIPEGCQHPSCLRHRKTRKLRVHTSWM